MGNRDKFVNWGIAAVVEVTLIFTPHGVYLVGNRLELTGIAGARGSDLLNNMGRELYKDLTEKYNNGELE